MYGILLLIHILICVALMLVVLLQSGKGGGLAGAFGWSGAQTIFGGRGAGNMLSKATSILGGLFMLTSLTLALLTGSVAKSGGKSILQKAREKEKVEQPASRPGTRLPTGTIPQAGTSAPQGQAVSTPQAPPVQKSGAAPAGTQPSGTPVKGKTVPTKTGETGGK